MALFKQNIIFITKLKGSIDILEALHTSKNKEEFKRQIRLIRKDCNNLIKELR